MISAALSSASVRPVMVAAALAWIADHFLYSSSGMSRIAMQSVRRPSVAYSCAVWTTKHTVSLAVPYKAIVSKSTHLEVIRRCLGKDLPLAREPLEDDRVGALAVQLDLALRRAHDGRHALARAVELEDVEHLVLALSAVDRDEDRLRLASLLRSWEVNRRSDERREGGRTVNV